MPSIRFLGFVAATFKTFQVIEILIIKLQRKMSNEIVIIIITVQQRHFITIVFICFFFFSLSMHSMHNIFKCEQRIGWLNVIVIWRDTARHSLLTWVVPLFHLYDIYLYVRQYLLGCSFLFTIFKHTFWKLTEELNNKHFLNLLNGVVFFSRFAPKTSPIRFVELFQIGSDYCGILFLFH